MTKSICKDSYVSEKHINDTSYVISDFEIINSRFGPRKEDSLLLSNIYAFLGMTNRSQRVGDCGDYLEFTHEFDINTGEFSDKGHLSNANFCRDLLCPMCQWRKSLKQLSNLSAVLNHSNICGNYKVLMITFTIPNVAFKDLDKGINKINSGFDRFIKKTKYRKGIKGYFKSIEVTVNLKSKTFHPHMHVLVLVDKDYGKRSAYYFTHDEILNDWRNSCRDQTITQVDIRAAYKSDPNSTEEFTLESAALEVAKYCAKVPSNCYTPEIILNLIKGLSNRRMYSYGGVMKETLRALKLDDAETADLIHIDDIVPEPVMTMIVTYGWTTSGYQIKNTRLKGDNANV